MSFKICLLRWGANRNWIKITIFLWKSFKINLSAKGSCGHVCNPLYHYERSFPDEQIIWLDKMICENFLKKTVNFLCISISSVKISCNTLLKEMVSVEYYWCWLYQLSVTLCMPSLGETGRCTCTVWIHLLNSFHWYLIIFTSYIQEKVDLQFYVRCYICFTKAWEMSLSF